MLIHRSPRAFVFAFCRCQNRIHACDQAAIKITFLKVWFDYVFDYLFARRVGQSPFKTISRLNAHLPICDEHQKQRPIIAFLLADSPCLVNSLSVIFQRGIALHFRKNGDNDLARSLAFEIFEQRIQL